ncbi:MAG: DUF1905 domain-containing protein [Candidatus Omnitrophica bacterium]|nr:DUF1905 domain-containing protein [Candidatus Omnitrophota bacterium]MDE2232266.1 DUF1905 domain-containing protein [Candidatus Omnitrophota bacterium]
MKSGLLKFKSVIKIRGINPYVHVSSRDAAFIKKNWRRPMPVKIRLNGKPDCPWHINMMPAGDGSFYLYLHGSIRKAVGVGPGDTVELMVEFDEAYRNGPLHSMPSWFAVQLDRNRQARQGWDGLAPSRQKEILRYFSELKSIEAKERNCQKALHVLAGNEGRFMARSWPGD